MLKNQIVKEYKRQRMVLNSKTPHYTPLVKKVFLDTEKKKAKERMRELELDHLVYTRDNAVVIMLAGENSKKVGELARSEFSGLVFDIDEFFLDLAKSVPPINYSSNGISRTAFDFMVAKLEDIAYECGILSLNYPVVGDEYNCGVSSAEELGKVFRKLVVDKIGGEFISAIATAHASRMSLDKGQDRDIYPVFMLSDSKKDVKKILSDSKTVFKRSYLITTDGDPLDGAPVYTVTRANARDLTTALDAVKKQYKERFGKKMKNPECLVPFRGAYVKKEVIIDKQGE